MHQEVIKNLESIHGALLRMNRSIQAEGTFGIMKNDRWYKSIVRRGIHSVKLEFLLVAIGHNLYKYQKKKMRNRTAAQIQKRISMGQGKNAFFAHDFSHLYTTGTKREMQKNSIEFFHIPFICAFTFSVFGYRISVVKYRIFHLTNPALVHLYAEIHGLFQQHNPYGSV